MIYFFLLLFLNSYGEETKEEVFTYTKAPKSLFLIKKASLGSDVGEPKLPLIQSHKLNILRDNRLEIKND